MMSIAHRQLEEMRLEREAEEAARKAATNGETITEVAPQSIAPKEISYPDNALL